MGTDSRNPDHAGGPALEGALQNLVQTLPGSFVVLEPDDHRIAAASHDFLEATNRGRDQLIGRVVTEAFPNRPDDPLSNGADHLRQSLDRVKASGRADSMGLRRHPIRVETASGERFEDRYWHPVCTPVTADDGRLCWIILRADDVTGLVGEEADDREDGRPQHPEHRRLRHEMAGANAELQARRAQLEQAQQLAGIHSFELDPVDGRLHWPDRLNPLSRAGTTQPPESLDAFLESARPQDGERVRAMLRGLPEQGGAEHLTVRMIRSSDGAERIIHIIAESLAGEQGPRIAGLVQDVTHITRQEAELEEATHGLRMAGRLARVGTWRGRADEDRVHWSAMTAEIHQRPELRVVDTAVALGFYAEADRARIAAALKVCMARGEPQDETGRVITASGETVWARVIAEPEMDAAGRVVAVRGVFQDITELRRLDERARHSQKLEAVGQLTGGVAHDFNNLLTVILGNAEILSKELRDPSRRAMAEVITTAAERGSELTGRLLAFARRQALAPSRIDLDRLIADMDGLLRRTLSEEIEIELDLDPRSWPVELDAGQLEVALLNLAVNARDAMPGGGRLTLATANIRLDEQAAAARDLEPGNHVRVTVADTGSGIPAAVLDRVFEPFFTTKEVGKGSGLGLSMVYGFVKQSGGHVQIESEPGRGTRVVLWLPRSEAGAPPTAEPDRTETLPGGSEHVLVVEDDSMVRLHLSRQLELLGYRVSTAESGGDALLAMERIEDLDLLLTDVVMPGGMNGRELAERALELRPDLALLYTSGYPEEAISRDGRLEEGVALLAKPYRRRDVALQVRAVLDARPRG